MKSNHPHFLRTLRARLRPHVRPVAFPAAMLAGWLLLSPPSGWARVTAEARRPAPSSSLSKSEALRLGVQWRLTNPALRNYCEVQPTGSMVPILDSRCVLLLERVTADQLRKNDISIYLRADDITICHRVMDVRDGGVLFEGDNSPRSDGWVAPDRVLWRVTAIIFTQRDDGGMGSAGRGTR